MDTAQAPASPPEIIEHIKDLALFYFGFLHFINFLKTSFRASLRALLGNIFRTLTPFPLHSDLNPSFLTTLLKQSVRPLYYLALKLLLLA